MNIDRAAKRIVAAIELDLTSRRGLRQEWDQIDAETKKEIRDAWRRNAKDILRIEGKK